MTREDILKLARVVGLRSAVLLHIYDGREGALTDQELAELQRLERFFRLAYECGAYEAGAAAQREKVAHWMRNCGYATGHGDTIEALLDHLGTQIAEGLLMEREACAKAAETTICDTRLRTGVRIYGSKAAAAIRARGSK